MHQIPIYLEKFGDLSLYVSKTVTSNDSDHHFSSQTSTGRIQSTEFNSTEVTKADVKTDANKEELVNLLLNDWKTD